MSAPAAAYGPRCLFQPKGMIADELTSGFALLNRQAYFLAAMTWHAHGNGLSRVAKRTLGSILPGNVILKS